MISDYQRLADGSVIPAAGRRVRDRSPSVERGIRCLSPQPRLERGRSLPPSLRTTSCDIIELYSTDAGWLRRAMPCLGLQVSPVRQGPPGFFNNLATSSQMSSAAPVTTPASPVTPVFVPATPVAATVRTPEVAMAAMLMQPEVVIPTTPLFVPAPPPATCTDLDAAARADDAQEDVGWGYQLCWVPGQPPQPSSPGQEEEPADCEAGGEGDLSARKETADVRA